MFILKLACSAFIDLLYIYIAEYSAYSLCDDHLIFCTMHNVPSCVVLRMHTVHYPICTSIWNSLWSFSTDDISSCGCGMLSCLHQM